MLNSQHNRRDQSSRASFAMMLAAALGLLGMFSSAAQLIAQQGIQQPASEQTTRPSVAPPSTLAITGATVIDVRTGQRLAGQTLVIVGNRIRALGAANAVHIPKGAQVVDATGSYVIPGLWDMHAHVDDNADQFYPQFIAYGVTGLREMAQRFPNGPDSMRAWQRQVMAGTRIGPRVYGPSADLTYQVSIETPADAVRIVDSLKATGALFLKVHDDNMDPTLYFAVAHEARRIGIPFVGHLPVGVTEVQASDSGQLTVEHVEENHHCWPNWPNPLDSLAAKRCAPAAAAYVRNGTWMSPTVVGARYYPEHNEPLAQQFVHMMHGMGVRMLSGTDFGIDMMPTGFRPGKSELEDVVLLAGAMTPLEGLQAATLNPAIYMHATDSLGTIAPGKLADLVVLAADPLTDITNINHIRAVVANGRYFDRAALDTMLLHAGPKIDTTSFALTDDLITHYIAVKRDLSTFWPSHQALFATAQGSARRTNIRVIPQGVNVTGPEVTPVGVFDYVALTAKDTALAALFAKDHFQPKQFEPTQVAAMKAVVSVALKKSLGTKYQTTLGAAAPTSGSIQAANIALAEQHLSDLQAVGVTFSLDQDGAGGP